MVRWLLVLAVSVVLVVGVQPVSAHDELGFAGTIQKLDAGGKTLVLTYRENGKDETVEITLTAKTAITRDKKRVAKTALTVGTRVKIQAYGCLGEEVDAHAIQILPATIP